jgi:hypothetical protein
MQRRGDDEGREPGLLRNAFEGELLVLHLADDLRHERVALRVCGATWMRHGSSSEKRLRAN